MKQTLKTILIPLLIIFFGFFYLSSVGRGVDGQFGGELLANFLQKSSSFGAGNADDDQAVSHDTFNNYLLDEDVVGDLLESSRHENELGPVGSMNYEFLQASPFSKLVIEIDYVVGSEPTEEGRNQAFLTNNAFVDKPDGIIHSGGNSIQEKSEIRNYNEIMELVEKNRNHYAGDDVVVLYIIFLDGEFFESRSALGTALNASSIAIFKDKVKQAATSEISESLIERSIVAHQIGHLWGLVNINYQSDIDHEDPGAPNHSKNPYSVMHWAVEHVDVAKLLWRGPSYQFDSADIDDIRKIKLGEY